VSKVENDQSPKAKLEALRTRLVDAQRQLLLAAAETSTIPPDTVLRKIALLESAISATEVLISEAD
jgi:hypothetical protein